MAGLPWPCPALPCPAQLLLFTSGLPTFPYYTTLHPRPTSDPRAMRVRDDFILQMPLRRQEAGAMIRSFHSTRPLDHIQVSRRVSLYRCGAARSITESLSSARSTGADRDDT